MFAAAVFLCGLLSADEGSHSALTTAGTSLRRAQDAQRNGEGDASREWVKRALDALNSRDDITNDVEFVRLAISLARLSSKAERFDQEIRSLEQITVHCNKNELTELKSLQNIHRLLAQAMMRSGRMRDSLAVEQRLLAYLRKSPGVTMPELFKSTANVGTLLFHLGRFRESKNELVVAQEIAARIFPENHPDRVIVRANLSLVRATLGDTFGARLELDGIVHLMDPAHPAQPTIRLNVALAEAQLGEFDATEKLQRLLAEGSLSPRQAAKATSGLITILRAEGRTEDALCLAWNYHDQVERIGLNQYDTLLARVELGRCMVANRDFLEGYEYLRSAADELLSRGSHEDLLGILADIVRAQISREEFPASLTTASEIVDEVERVLDLPIGSLTNQDLEHLALARHREVSAAFDAFSRETDEVTNADERRLFELWESIRVVRAQANRAISLAGATRSGADVLQWRRRIFDLASSTTRVVSEMAPKITEADASVLEVEASTARLREAVGARLPVLSADDVASSLDERAIAIVYRIYASSRGGNHLAAFVLRPDKSLSRIQLGPYAKIRERIREYRDSITAPLSSARGLGDLIRPEEARRARAAREERLQRSSEELRKAVFDPLRALIGNARQIHLVFDGDLHLIPVDTLPRGGGKGRLFDEFEFAVHNTLYELVEEKRRAIPNRRGLLCLGGIDFSQRDGFGALPQGKLEIEDVAQLFESANGDAATVLSGEGATRKKFLSEAAHAQFVHVSTHGVFRLHAAARVAPATCSGIVLRSEKGNLVTLTAEELAWSELTGCRLVVLSACGTGLGLGQNGQGLASLQLSLYAAGVESSVTSLWDVGDSQTREFMRSFYTRVWRSRHSPRQALRKTKREFRDKNVPYVHWAGWVHCGAW